jgi:hypothetical protein
MGKDKRFDVAVTFDERRGYVGTAAGLHQPVVALSLGGLRRKAEALMLPDDVIVTTRQGRPPGARSPAAHRAAAQDGTTR